MQNILTYLKLCIFIHPDYCSSHFELNLLVIEPGVCVCVCACVRACVRACLRACVRACVRMCFESTQIRSLHGVCVLSWVRSGPYIVSCDSIVSLSSWVATLNCSCYKCNIDHYHQVACFMFLTSLVSASKNV